MYKCTYPFLEHTNLEIICQIYTQYNYRPKQGFETWLQKKTNMIYRYVVCTNINPGNIIYENM